MTLQSFKPAPALVAYPTLATVELSPVRVTMMAALFVPSPTVKTVALSCRVLEDGVGVGVAAGVGVGVASGVGVGVASGVGVGVAAGVGVGVGLESGSGVVVTAAPASILSPTEPSIRVDVSSI